MRIYLSEVDATLAQEVRPRLYEQRGWRRVRGEPSAAHDRDTLLHYYVAPPAKDD